MVICMTGAKKENIGKILMISGLCISPFFSNSLDFCLGAFPLCLMLFGGYIYFKSSIEFLYNKYFSTSIIILLILCLISCILSSNQYLSGVSCLFLLGCLLVIFIISNMSRCRDFFLYLIMVIFGIGLIISIYSVAQMILNYGGGVNFFDNLSKPDFNRLFGVFLNPNLFAAYLSICILLGLGLLFIFKSNIIKLLILIGIFISTCALLLTGSKFGFVSFSIGLITFVFFAIFLKCPFKKNIIPVVIIVLIIFTSLFFIGKPLISRATDATTGGTQVHSTTFRIYTWKSTLDMIKNNPIQGVSPGRFAEAYPDYTIASITKHAHNSYLQFASEYGIIISFILLLWLCFIIYFCFGFIKRRNNFAELSTQEIDNANRLYLFAGVAGATASILVHNLVDSDWYLCSLGIISSVLLGMILSISDAKTEKLTLNRYKTMDRTFILVMILILWFGAGDFFVKTKNYSNAINLVPFNGNAWLGYASEQDSLERTLYKLQKAKSYNPKNYYVYQRLGDFYATLNPKSDDVLNNYETALLYHPKSTLLMMRMIKVANNRKDTALAEKYYDKLLKQENTPYEKIKGLPEMVDNSYAFANFHKAENLLKENRIADAEKRLKKAKLRLKRWTENKDYILIALINMSQSPQKVESEYNLYKEVIIKLGEINKTDPSSELEDLDNWYNSLIKDFSELTKQMY